MSIGFSDLAAQKAMDDAPRIPVGQLRVTATNGASREEAIKGYVTVSGLSRAMAESTAREDGAAYLGAHSAIRKDADGTYSVIRIDTRQTPTFDEAQTNASDYGVAGIMKAHDTITETLKSSAKAEPGYTFID